MDPFVKTVDEAFAMPVLRRKCGATEGIYNRFRPRGSLSDLTPEGPSVGVASKCRLWSGRSKRSDLPPSMEASTTGLQRGHASEGLLGGVPEDV